MFPLLRYKFKTKEQLIFNFVLHPLVEAYDIGKRDENMVNDNENTITRKLVWYLKNETSISPLYQKRILDVIMRSKEHVTIDEIYEPDIQIKINKLLWMEIEAKRIYELNSWSTTDYLNKGEGIGRFLSGKYSKNKNHAGMIAYIQNGNLQSIIQNIKTGLKSLSCRKCENIKEIENCLFSIHYRANNDDIGIHHLFFHFTPT